MSEKSIRDNSLGCEESEKTAVDNSYDRWRKSLKKDPYKFCIENGIIEGNGETESDNDETSTDQEG